MKVNYANRYALHFTTDARRTAKRMNIGLMQNYTAVPVRTHDFRYAVLVQGKDVDRWTLDGYIIPRLSEYALSEIDRREVRLLKAL